ncbi:MAG: reticulocyte-binding protein [Nevskia sp.]|nr:reticulocyte-binding protein [Nevskia sp.]
MDRKRELGPVGPPVAVRFDNNCAPLPTELVKAQEKGEVVVICGAGVSRTVGLPSFLDLVKGIYCDRNENWDSHPAERAAMEPGAGQMLDRAVFALRLRLGGRDRRTEHQARANILAAVQAQLAAPAQSVALSNHLSLLRLSRDAERRPCLVTTNFDTLFERSWMAYKGTELPSRACADLPAPRSPDFHGVLHLHGRISDEVLNLPRTDIVLDSAEFGEAYLRSGWAARYVYDLARAVTVVIVGYGADDPPMRYLLEVLTADRARFPDLREIYAFVSTDPMPEARSEKEALWRAKGATPILYDSTGPADHAALYHTLQTWAEYSENPKLWWGQEAQRIFALDPSTLGGDDWERIRWILTRGDGMRILAESNPSPAWAVPLYQEGLLGADATNPGPWIRANLHQREMLLALITGFKADAGLIQELNLGLVQRSLKLQPLVAQAWRLVFRAWTQALSRGAAEWYAASHMVEIGDTSLDVRRRIARELQPILEIRRPFQWFARGATQEDPVDSLDKWLRVDFEISTYLSFDAIFLKWPKEKDSSLLQTLERCLESTLEEAADCEFDRPGFSQSSSDVPSIAPHPQNQHRQGFLPLVSAITKLWERLATNEPAAAIRFGRRWSESSYVLFRRLWLHALTNSVFQAEDAGSAILALTDDDFWSDELRREAMRLIGSRWPELGTALRAQLEMRIVEGPPRRLFIDDADPSTLRNVMLHYSFVRLMRIVASGSPLSATGRIALTKIKAEYPTWETAEEEKDDFGRWSGRAMHSAGGDPTRLEGVPAERLIERARELAQANEFSQGSVWPLFCQADPSMALAGLVSKLDQGEFAEREWSSFLWSQRLSTDVELVARIFAAMEHHNFVVDDSQDAAVDFMVEQFSRIRSLPEMPSRFLALCDRATDQLTSPHRAVVLQLDQDLPNRVLGRTEGRLIALIVKELQERDIAGGAGFPSDIRNLLDRLANASGASGIITRVSMSYNLPFFHSIDPDWVESALVPHMTWADQPGRAMWNLYVLNNAIGLARLFNKLKPTLLDGFSQIGLNDDTLGGLVDRLLRVYATIVRHSPQSYLLLSREVKSALAQGGIRALRVAAFEIARGILSSLDREEAWSEWAAPLFQQIWPMDACFQDQVVTRDLVRLALSARDSFPAAIDILAPAMTHVDRGIGMWLSSDQGYTETAEKYPKATMKLFYAVTDRNAPPDDLGAWLDRLLSIDPSLSAALNTDALLTAVRRAGA